MTGSLLALAFDLERRGEPFAMATVVRCEPPTSAKPGACAIVRADGSLSGWVGGACAEPVVVREALAALADGRPRLIGLVGDGGADPGRSEGVLTYPMTCHSGGTLEIYVEPHLPQPLLVLVGRGPVVDALAALGRTAGYAVTLVDASEGARASIPALTRRTSVVVASHGDTDEEALVEVLASDAGYVSLVASRRRGAVVLERLERRGVPAERLSRLKVPAGLDLGAVEPGEIAVSILAEIVQHRRSDKGSAAEPAASTATLTSGAAARDPVCGMTVDPATARHRSEAADRVIHFCCGGCKEAFDRDPTRYLAGSVPAGQDGA